jgi:hypothetical protein
VARKTTPSFVRELPLQTTAAGDHSLAEEGYTPLRRAVRRGVVGLDIGPSNIAAVSADEAMFERFCASVEQPEAFLRAASDNFEPVSGRGFASPHVTIAARAGRSKNTGQKVREAEGAVALVARASESGVIWSSPGVT